MAKRWNVLKVHNSGIIERDMVETDDIVAFVHAVNKNPRVTYHIVDWSRLVVGLGEREIVENPTHGRVGKIDPTTDL